MSSYLWSDNTRPVKIPKSRIFWDKDEWRRFLDAVVELRDLEPQLAWIDVLAMAQGQVLHPSRWRTLTSSALQKVMKQVKAIAPQDAPASVKLVTQSLTGLPVETYTTTERLAVVVSQLLVEAIANLKLVASPTELTVEVIPPTIVPRLDTTAAHHTVTMPVVNLKLAPRHRKLKVMIVGLFDLQKQTLKKNYSDRVDLRMIDNDMASSAIRAHVQSADVVIGFIKHMSHAVDGALRNACRTQQKKYHGCPGGLTAISHLIDESLTDRMTKEDIRREDQRGGGRVARSSNHETQD